MRKQIYHFPFMLVYRQLGRKVYEMKGFLTEDEMNNFIKQTNSIVDVIVYKTVDKQLKK